VTTPLRPRLDDFKALRHLIYQHSGIWLGDTRTNFLGVRIAERLRALAISTPRVLSPAQGRRARPPAWATRSCTANRR